MAFPWAALAMGGAAIFESLFGKEGVSKEFKSATSKASSKASELFDSTGFDKRLLAAIFGENFENIRAQKAAGDVARTETFNRAGMGGTGAAIKAGRQDAWSNERLVSEAMRDLLITGEAKKSSDIALGGQLLQAASGAEQTKYGTQGEGPALTEALMTALLLGMKKPGKGAAIDQSGLESMFPVNINQPADTGAFDWLDNMVGQGWGSSYSGRN